MKSISMRSLYGVLEKHHKWSLALLMVLGIVFMIAWGKSKSSVSFHIDEIWQYSFANSYGKTTSVVDHGDFGKWLPSTVFRDYITVQPGEGFSFRQITESDKQDIHPPLSHYALNIVCSFFPDSFSRWYGLVVNMVCYVVTMGLLYALANLLFASKGKALITTTIWAFSIGAVSTVMYIRMYCMLTMFSVAVVLFSVKYLKGYGYRYLFLTYCSFVLAGLTDYIFWIFGFFATLAFIIVQWNQNTRSWMYFAAASFCSFVTACLVFPTTVMQFLDENSLSNRSTEDFNVVNNALKFLDVPAVLSRLLNNTSEQGLLVSPGVIYGIFWTILILAAAALLALLFIAFYSAFASERSGVSASSADPIQINAALVNKSKSVLRNGRTVFYHNLWDIARNATGRLAANGDWCFIALTILPTAYILALIFPDFQIWTLRAFFIFYPFLALGVAAVLFWLREQWRVPAVALVVLTVILLIRGYLVVGTPFLFNHGYDKIKSKVKDADVIFVLESSDSLMRLPNFCVPLLRANRVFMINMMNGNFYENMFRATATADKNKDIIVINTIGAPPANQLASSVLGPELLLTNDQAIVSTFTQYGYSLEVLQHSAQIFQWFNIYRINYTPPEISDAASITSGTAVLQE